MSVRPRLKAPSKGDNIDDSKSGKKGLLSYEDELSSQSSSVPNQVPLLRALLDSELAKVSSSSSASSSVASFEPARTYLQPPQQVSMTTMSERDLKMKLLEEELNLTKNGGARKAKTRGEYYGCASQGKQRSFEWLW